MSQRVLALFSDPSAALEAAKAADRDGFTLAESYSPFPLESVGKPVAGLNVIGWAAFAGAVIGGGGVFALETFSTMVAYPFNSGGRPPFSWPVLTLSAFEIGVLCAGLFSLAAFLFQTGLPQLHHPAFDLQDFERVSQDRIILIYDKPRGAVKAQALADILTDAETLREVSL